jgi:hypothetical protein
MDSRKKIKAREIIRDIEEFKLSDTQLMSKYGFSPVQLLIVFGRLSEAGLMSSVRMIWMVDRYRSEGQISLTLELMAKMQDRFPSTRGIKALAERIKRETRHQELNRSKLEKMSKLPPVLSKLYKDHPNILLNTEIERMLQIFEASLDFLLSKTPREHHTMVDVSQRMEAAILANRFQQDLPLIQANRAWHINALELFRRHDIQHYQIASVSDSMACETCSQITGLQFKVTDILQRIKQSNTSGGLNLDNPLPKLRPLLNESHVKKRIYLLKRGAYLPPYCWKCTCQILPANDEFG